jgi:hypothetical protein
MKEATMNEARARRLGKALYPIVKEMKEKGLWVSATKEKTEEEGRDAGAKEVVGASKGIPDN